MRRDSSDTHLRQNKAAPPPIDRVARVLWRDGARDCAVALLRAAIRRDPNGERTSEALLRAVEARPDASVSGPDLVINLDLIDMYLSRGYFAESIAIMAGAKMNADADQRERNEWATLMVTLSGETEPARLVEAEKHIAEGQARLGLSIFEHWRATPAELPTWAQRKFDLLSRILIRPATDDDAGTSPTLPLLVRSCLDHLAQRDVAGVVKTLEAHCNANPADSGALEVLTSFRRLSKPIGVDGNSESESRTMAMSPEATAELHVHMANYKEAHRLYLVLALEAPESLPLAERSYDLEVVTTFLAGGRYFPGTIPPPEKRMSMRAPAPPPSDDAEELTLAMVGDAVVIRRIIVVT